MSSQMHLFHSCIVGKRWLGAFKEYLNGGRHPIEMPTDSKRSETPMNQHRTWLEGLAKAIDFFDQYANYGYLSHPFTESANL